MKLSSSLLIFASVFIISSCGSGEQNASSGVSIDTVKVAVPTEITDMTGIIAYYECPMKCEGKKFADMGACTVCGMDLVKIEVAATSGEQRDHAHDSTHQH